MLFLRVHLEIDTGMARQGVAPGEELHTLLHWLKRQPQLRLDGVMTHFASSEVAGSPMTLAQRRRFEEAIAAVAAAGLRPSWVHAGNSSTVDNQGAEENLVWLRSLALGLGARSICPGWDRSVWVLFADRAGGFGRCRGRCACSTSTATTDDVEDAGDRAA